MIHDDHEAVKRLHTLIAFYKSIVFYLARYPNYKSAAYVLLFKLISKIKYHGHSYGIDDFTTAKVDDAALIADSIAMFAREHVDLEKTDSNAYHKFKESFGEYTKYIKSVFA